ncbi:unnamed protein product [Calypogeia fissa]
MAAAMAAAASVSTSWGHCSGAGRAERGIVADRSDDFRQGFLAGRRRYAFVGEDVSGSLRRKSIKALEGKGSNGGKRSALKNGSISALLTEMATETLLPVDEKDRADPKTVVSIILGGGAGTRLFPLTKRRAKPAVPIGGGYRLIDVPMSNCINSGINKVFILTQFNSFSLNRHLARTYNFGNGINFGSGFVEVLAATQTPGEGGKEWFQGTADAVRQYLWLFEDAKNKDLEDVLVLSGDHLYRMDYMDFIQKHRDSGADITISCVPMDDSRASDYGLMKIDGTGRVVHFSEKPKGADLKAMQVDTSILGLSAGEAKLAPYIASMGIYVFKKEILLKLLRWRFPTSNDFGSEIIPACIPESNVQAYLFKDYWEDIGTIKSFFEANLALTAQPPKFKFYDADKPIFTSPRYLPPSKIEKCRVVDSIVSHGCFIRESKVTHSVIGLRSQLDTGCDLQDTFMLGADFYETDAERTALLAQGKIPVGVGKNSIIRNAIIDKNARIGSGVVITNTDNVQEAERPKEGYYIRTGITVITKNSTIPNGTVI